MRKIEDTERKMKALLKTFPTAQLKETLLKYAVDMDNVDSFSERLVREELSIRISPQEFIEFMKKSDKMCIESYEKIVEESATAA